MSHITILRWSGGWLACLAAMLLSGCVGVPANTQAVDHFSLDRYLGRWYEVARLDHRFEKGLDCVTATYAKRNDGGVRVVNRGVSLATGKVSQAEGRAYAVAGPDNGRFKVSFFGPFYGGYNILWLDRDYQTVIIAGSNRDYLWIMARSPHVTPVRRQELIARAQGLGFATDKLVVVRQDSTCEAFRQKGQTS